MLGVSRDADERTIKKAFKTAAKKAHPDLPGGSEEKMASLNEAYEVLSSQGMCVGSSKTDRRRTEDEI